MLDRLIALIARMVAAWRHANARNLTEASAGYTIYTDAGFTYEVFTYENYITVQRHPGGDRVRFSKETGEHRELARTVFQGKWDMDALGELLGVYDELPHYGD